MESVQINAGFVIDSAELHRSIVALALDGEVKPFVDYVSRKIFRKLSNRDLRRFDEKYIKIMLLTCLFQSRIYVPISETETDTGYIDIYLHRSPLLPEVRYEWIFEIKYLKASEKSLDAYRLEAQNQLQRYGSSAIMKDSKELKKVVILFIGKNKYELFEQ
jgi:dipeptidyl aminopeptidase/acylaminoacyl peptidase